MIAAPHPDDHIRIEAWFEGADKPGTFSRGRLPI